MPGNKLKDDKWYVVIGTRGKKPYVEDTVSETEYYVSPPVNKEEMVHIKRYFDTFSKHKATVIDSPYVKEAYKEFYQDDGRYDIRLLTLEKGLDINRDQFLMGLWELDNYDGPVLIKQGDKIYGCGAPEFRSLTLLENKNVTNLMRHFPDREVSQNDLNENNGVESALAPLCTFIRKEKGILTKANIAEINKFHSPKKNAPRRWTNEQTKAFQEVMLQQQKEWVEKNKVDIIFILGRDSYGKSHFHDSIKAISTRCKQNKLKYLIVGDGNKHVDTETLRSLPPANYLYICAHGGVNSYDGRHSVSGIAEPTVNILQTAQQGTQYKYALIASCYSGAVAKNIRQSKPGFISAGTYIMLSSPKDEPSFIYHGDHMRKHFIDTAAKKLNIIEFSQSMVMSNPETLGFLLIPSKANWSKEHFKQHCCFTKVTEQAKKHIFHELDRYRACTLVRLHQYFNQLITNNRHQPLEVELKKCNKDKNNLFPVDDSIIMKDKIKYNYGKEEFYQFYLHRFILTHALRCHSKIIDSYLTQFEQWSKSQVKNLWKNYTALISKALISKEDLLEFFSIHAMHTRISFHPKEQANYYLEYLIDRQKYYPSTGIKENQALYDTVNVLIKHGADIYSTHDDSKTLLHQVIASSNTALIMALINCGKDAKGVYALEHIMKQVDANIMKRLFFSDYAMKIGNKLTNETKKKIKNFAANGSWLKESLRTGNTKALSKLLEAGISAKNYSNEQVNSLMELAANYDDEKTSLTMMKLLKKSGFHYTSKAVNPFQYELSNTSLFSKPSQEKPGDLNTKVESEEKGKHVKKNY